MSKTLFESIFYSIKWRVISNVILLHAVLMILVVVDNISSQKSFIADELKNESIGLAKALALNAPTWLLINDLTALEELIEGYKGLENVSSAMIIDKKGKIRATTEKSLFNKVLDDETSVRLMECAINSKKECFMEHHALADVLYPIKSGDSTIGYARVMIDAKLIEEKIEQSAKMGLIYVLAAIVIGGVIAWFTIKNVTAKLNGLSLAAERISNGDFDVDIKEYKGKDEASKLSHAFLYMSKRLKERMDEKEKMLMQQSKMAAMGDMIGAIAHQLKQPLNVVAVVKDNINDEAEYDEITKEKLLAYTDTIDKQIRYMSNTIDDFRNFFIPDKDERSFSVKSVIGEVYDLISFQLKNHNVLFSVIGDDFFIKAHKNEFKQAILNIINNSKDAIFEKTKKRELEKGKIEIRVSKCDDKQGEIVIQDNGGGIKNEVMDRLFEPYITTKGEKGTGVGLYMVKRIIVERLKGEINIQNVDLGLQTKIKLKTEHE